MTGCKLTLMQNLIIVTGELASHPLIGGNTDYQTKLIETISPAMNEKLKSQLGSLLSGAEGHLYYAERGYNDALYSVGICSAIRGVLRIEPGLGVDFSTAIFSVIFASWPGFSGSLLYPIATSRPEYSGSKMYSMTPFRMFYNETTEYGRMRMNLLRYVIKSLREIIDTGEFPMPYTTTRDGDIAFDHGDEYTTDDGKVFRNLYAARLHLEAVDDVGA